MIFVLVIRKGGLCSALMLTLAIFLSDAQTSAPTLQQAHDLFNQAKYKECFQAVSAYLQLAPRSAGGYKILGMDEYMLGQTKEAVTHLIRATELAPRDSETFYYLGRLYFSSDNPQAALLSFQKAILLDDSSVRSRNHLGQSLEALGRYEEAELAYIDAIKVAERQATQSEWPYYNLGLLYLHDSRIDESVTQFRKALICKPNFVEAKVKLAVALSAQNHLTDAKSLLEDALRIDPSNAEAHYRLGVVLLKSGQSRNADEQFALFEKSRKP